MPASWRLRFTALHHLRGLRRHGGKVLRPHTRQIGADLGRVRGRV
jgi:hypothetical protein